RYVYVDRTIAFAAFACETKIECFLDVLTAPTVFDDLSVQHLPQQVSAASRAVLLFMGNHEAGTHSVLLTFTRRAATLPYTDTAQSGASEAALIFRKFKVGRWFPGAIIRPQAEVFIYTIGINHLARIHLPVRVPNRCKFAKGLHQL